MSEYRKQIGVAVLIALVGAFSFAILANYSFPTQPGVTTGIHNSSTASISPGPTVTTTTSGSESASTGLTTTTVITLPPTSSPTQNGTTVYPVANDGVNFTEAVLAAQNSPAVQGYISKAYSYSVEQAYLGKSEPSLGGPVLVFVTFNVTAGRSVSGNWTTGYSITYSGRAFLNATVEFTAPSTYQVTNLAVANLPSANQSVSFTSQQQRVIQVALSNSTVKQYTTQSEYYVQSVTYFPPNSGNETFAGDYLVYIGQVNGSCVIGIFVNPNTNSVVTTYNDTRMVCD
jgi:hypothetical protein